MWYRTTPIWWSWKFKSYNLLQHLLRDAYSITYFCSHLNPPTWVLLQGWGHYHLHILHARRFSLRLKGWLDPVSIHVLGDQITGSEFPLVDRWLSVATVQLFIFQENCWFGRGHWMRVDAQWTRTTTKLDLHLSIGWWRQGRYTLKWHGATD